MTRHLFVDIVLFSDDNIVCECAWPDVTSWPMATAAQGAERWDEEKQRQAELTVQRALANWKAQQQEPQ